MLINDLQSPNGNDVLTAAKTVPSENRVGNQRLKNFSDSDHFLPSELKRLVINSLSSFLTA